MTILTEAQHERLDKLPEDVRVVGWRKNGPLIENPVNFWRWLILPNGKLKKVF